MRAFPRKLLHGTDVGRHYASEHHLRIQVLRLMDGQPRNITGEELFAGYHGELLLVALEGNCVVETAGEELVLEPGDQALLVDGEPFRLRRRPGDAAPLVELIWTPGLNACRACWENGDRYFGETAGEPLDTKD